MSLSLDILKRMNLFILSLKKKKVQKSFFSFFQLVNYCLFRRQRVLPTRPPGRDGEGHSLPLPGHPKTHEVHSNGDAFLRAQGGYAGGGATVTVR